MEFFLRNSSLVTFYFFPTIQNFKIKQKNDHVMLPHEFSKLQIETLIKYENFYNFLISLDFIRYEEH